MNEQEEIDKFIARFGVKKLPSKPAFVLGETNPGWRRNIERTAELAQKRGRKKTPLAHQRFLRQRVK